MQRRMLKNLSLTITSSMALLVSCLSAQPTVAAADSTEETRILQTNEEAPASEFEPQAIEELTDARTANSETSLEPDGSLTTTIYPAPIHFQGVDGDWHPIDNTLVDSSLTGYLVRNQANDYRLQIPAEPSQDPVRFAASGEWVEFTSQDAEGEPTVLENTVSIAGIDGGGQLEYEAVNQGVKETIVLPKPPAGTPEWSFLLDVSPGITPEMMANGGIAFRDASGDAVFSVPAPFMFDASNSVAGYSESVSLQLVEHEGAWRLTVLADAEWLADPARIYPVRIDPTITTKDVTDCWINRASPDTKYCGAGSPYVRVGSLNGNGRRGLLKFALGSIPRDITLESATLSLSVDPSETTEVRAADYGARRMTHKWTDSATWNTWDGVSPWNEGGGDFYHASQPSISLNGSTSGYRHFDVPNIVENWVQGVYPNNGFVVKQVVEDVDSVIAFHSSDGPDVSTWPKLTVSYIPDTTGDVDDYTSCPDVAEDTVCLPVGVTTPTGVDPEVVTGDPNLDVEAVKQSLLAGETAAASDFVTARAAEFDDHAQSEMEDLIVNGLTPGEAEEAVDYDPEIPLDVLDEEWAAQPMMVASPYNDHYAGDMSIYRITSSGQRHLVSTTSGEWITSLDDHNVHLSGELYVSRGPVVNVTEHRCRIRYQRFGPDVTKHTWKNCAGSTVGGAKLIHVVRGQTVFKFPGTRGGDYHNDYKVSINPDGPAPERTFEGYYYSDDLRSRTWHYPQAGGRPAFKAG